MLRVLVVDRFKYGKGDDIGLNFLVFKLAARGAVKNGEAQGYGRHSQEERIYNLSFKF